MSSRAKGGPGGGVAGASISFQTAQTSFFCLRFLSWFFPLFPAYFGQHFTSLHGIRPPSLLSSVIARRVGCRLVIKWEEDGGGARGSVARDLIPRSQRQSKGTSPRGTRRVKWDR